MIKKVTLEKVSRFNKDKTGNPLKTKDGKAYERVLLTVKGQTISGFGAQYNQDWKAGDEVSIDITTVEKEGKTYYNFGQVNVTSQLLQRFEDLEKRVAKLEGQRNSDGSLMPDFGQEPPVEVYKDEDIQSDMPF